MQGEIEERRGAGCPRKAIDYVRVCALGVLKEREFAGF